MEQLTLSQKRAIAGRKGYERAIERLGREGFHSAGGRAYVQLDLFTHPQTGEVGLEAARKAGLVKGKKHRYSQIFKQLQNPDEEINF